MLIWIRNNLLLILLSVSLVQCRVSNLEMAAIPMSEFSAGDLVFRRGRTLESDAIAAVGGDESGYSHVGVIVCCGDSLAVVHVEPKDGDEIVKMESIESFFHPRRAAKGCVARVDGLSEHERAIVQHEALALLQKRLPFDHDYSLQDSSAMYCSELVDFVFRKANIVLTRQRHKVPLVREAVILPADMLRDGALERVWTIYYDARHATTDNY